MKITNRFGLVLLAPLLASAYYLGSSELRSQLDASEDRRSTLHAELAKVTAAKDQREALATKYAAEQVLLSRYAGALPDTADTKTLVGQLQDAAWDSGVGLSFEAGAEEMQPLYVKVPLKVSVVGTYKAILEFLRRVDRMQRFTSVENVQIRSAKDGKSHASCVIAAFRKKTKEESEQKVPRR